MSTAADDSTRVWTNSSSDDREFNTLELESTFLVLKWVPRGKLDRLKAWIGVETPSKIVPFSLLKSASYLRWPIWLLNRNTLEFSHESPEKNPTFRFVDRASRNEFLTAFVEKLGPDWRITEKRLALKEIAGCALGFFALLGVAVLILSSLASYLAGAPAAVPKAAEPAKQVLEPEGNAADDEKPAEKPERDRRFVKALKLGAEALSGGPVVVYSIGGFIAVIAVAAFILTAIFPPIVVSLQRIEHCNEVRSE